MRNAFIDELVNFARNDKNIFLVVGDLGYSVIEPFVDEFNDRFINAGVSEQNMTGLAAGLASEGCHVFTYSIGNFSTFRCAEQIRNDISYHNLPVTVVSTGGGLSYGNLGYSHHAIQDYALMRSFPNLTIASPGDPNEVRSVMNYLLKKPGPSYLRLGKSNEPNFTQLNKNLFPGKWECVLKKNPKKTFLSTGTALKKAYNLVINEPEFNDFSIHTMPLWSIDVKKNQNEYLNFFDEVITIEDHLIDGGFGSWLLESCAKNRTNLNKIKIKAFNHKVTGVVGKQEILNEYGWLEK